MFEYHSLRDKEAGQWRREKPAATLAKEDPKAARRLADLVKKLVAFPPPHRDELVHVAPKEPDVAAAALCRAYRDATDLGRAAVRSLIRVKQAEILLSFSQRAAVRGIQTRRVVRIREALTAHAIENLAGGDVRDNLMALGLVYHCAAKVRRKPGELFEEAAAMAGPAIASLLRDFVHWDDDMAHILGGMGFVQVKVRGKTGFREEDDQFTEDLD
jgi:hypothetical protein